MGGGAQQHHISSLLINAKPGMVLVLTLPLWFALLALPAHQPAPLPSSQVIRRSTNDSTSKLYQVPAAAAQHSSTDVTSVLSGKLLIGEECHHVNGKHCCEEVTLLSFEEDTSLISGRTHFQHKYTYASNKLSNLHLFAAIFLVGYINLKL